MALHGLLKSTRSKEDQFVPIITFMYFCHKNDTVTRTEETPSSTLNKIELILLMTNAWNDYHFRNRLLQHPNQSLVSKPSVIVSTWLFPYKDYEFLCTQCLCVKFIANQMKNYLLSKIVVRYFVTFNQEKNGVHRDNDMLIYCWHHSFPGLWQLNLWILILYPYFIISPQGNYEGPVIMGTRQRSQHPSMS